MISVAFKEWAVVCRALATGTQSLILRKGGIADEGGLFRPEHESFLLYPTYFHEPQFDALKPSVRGDLLLAEADRPAAGSVTFRQIVTVSEALRLDSLDTAVRLDPFHIWSVETVAKRFHYRTPGLYALIVRTFVLPGPVSIPEDPSYAGCKSWVPLVSNVPTAEARPVLAENSFRRVTDSIRAAVA